MKIFPDGEFLYQERWRKNYPKIPAKEEVNPPFPPLPPLHKEIHATRIKGQH